MVALAIATAGGFLIRLWDVEKNTLLYTITTDHTSSIMRVAWSPDGKQIATASADSEVHVYDAQSGERLHRLTGHTGVVYDVAWSSDGRQLASAGTDFSVRVWNLSDENSVSFSASNLLHSIAWHLNNSYSSAGAVDGLVNVWAVSTGEHYTWKGHEAAVTSVTWDSTGQRLATAGQDGQIIIWDTSDGDFTTGRVWKQGFDLGEQVWDLDWHDTLLAASGINGSVKVWDVATGENVANYTGHIGAVRAVDWSPDGRYLVTVGMTDGVALVHPANFVNDLLPIALQQQERGSTAIDRTRCLEIIK